ncbi:MAG: ATP-binding cassette domain-containing protein [Steroidobacteraceae bacterium]|jgi:lipooligosaccharide transport system ATP-binding protein|nr:ATP-binding cassette domain-containing protein [Steroidobacteraceae bacterium]
MLHVQNLRKHYGPLEVVRGVSFHVPRGQCFGLLGPNGAGKTTTLRCCLGLTRPDSGEIRLAGLPVPDQAREARVRVGVVPQFDNLDPDFTVAENLVVFGRYFGLSRRQCEAKVDRLLNFAGLRDKAHARIEALSGGMKRRLTLARAMINDPQVLFMDEPTTGLDPQARHLVWDRLKTLITEGRTIVLTTHFMDEAQRLCDRVAIMDHGALVIEDAPRRLIDREIEATVIEVYGEGVEAWFHTHGSRLSTRAELAGDTAFCYSDDPEPLMKTLDGQSELRALRRAPNLEDVFLKLTGRDLRD